MDPQLHQSLLHLVEYLKHKKQIISDASSVKITKASAKSATATLISQIKVKDALIQDLCLDFTLPGYPQIELVANGASREVTMDNLEEYVMLVLDMVLGSGVTRQIKYFRRGFDKVFPLTDLKTFTPLELGIMFGSEQEEDWSYEGKVNWGWGGFDDFPTFMKNSVLLIINNFCLLFLSDFRIDQGRPWL